MRRALVFAGAALATFILFVLVFREPAAEWAKQRLTADMFLPGDSDDFDPGIAIGEAFPPIRALHDGVEIRSLAPFQGAAGTVLVASRSVDWCPYCMKQMVMLNQYREQFRTAGIGIVGMTYDDPSQQQEFARRYGVEIPLISDIEGSSFKALGILHPDYQPGDFQYGIPYPGFYVIDTAGVVVGKLFLEAYSTRVESADALAYARQRLGIDAG